MLHIGLQLRLRDSYDMAVARGVIRFARTRTDWELRGTGPWFLPLEGSGTRQCDALIARIEGDEDARQLRMLEVPIVDIAGACTDRIFDTVRNDDYATGVRAGEYLRNLGCDSYAWCGVENVHWARERLVGFCGAIGRSSGRIPRFERSLKWWERLYDASAELRRWLLQLPRPTILFCGSDLVAMKVNLEAGRLGIVVPDELSILGVDDEELLCELATPSLSSVKLNCERIGYEAALLLDRLLRESNGERSSSVSVRRIAPGDVVERESTAAILDADSVVAQTVRMIRRDACTGLNVSDLVKRLPVSRRSLEQRFRASRGRTVLEELHQERLRAACRLLRTTDLTVERIAMECGFSSLQRFYIQFRETYSMTPGRWRRSGQDYLPQDSEDA